ncbi:SDR family oxidoreductase [Streptomyces sp. NPDC006464]|uniref:SDR family oxidoreductase n=1 Tax=unclassified Streptomyces TaxID=2593676 RepID=UPI0033A08A8E
MAPERAVAERGGPFAPDLMRDRVVVVTGGSAGIGRDIAAQFLRHGARVAIASRQPERLDEAAAALHRETGRAPMTVVCDVRDATAVGALADRVTSELGPADTVINNAAANFRMPAERMTARAFGTVVDIDLIGTFNVTTAFVGPMLERGFGHVVSVVVPDADRGFPNCSHAGAAKAGIVSLTSSWAREWGPRGIRVNAVAPGPVPTEAVMSQVFSADGVAQGLVGGVPLGRLGTGTDVAHAVLFLASDAAAWITGTTLVVDGGQSTNSL